MSGEKSCLLLVQSAVNHTLVPMSPNNFLGSKSVPQGAAILLKIDECNCIHTAGQQRDRKSCGEMGRSLLHKRTHFPGALKRFCVVKLCGSVLLRHVEGAHGPPVPRSSVPREYYSISTPTERPFHWRGPVFAKTKTFSGTNL